MNYPIGKEALDDRLAIVGTAGSGKTYLTLGAIEHLLARKSRVIGVDPLGVMWGLRLCEDGKTPSPFQPVIFGGAHGDLPINEHAGALIGQTVATMRESCIIDLSTLGTKAAERRFMLAFLTALYRETDKEPVHLIVDEADMFAPQKLLDKEGDAAKLLGMMETVVRRGRVRGFIPWLITQRPAVLSKDVLSQADGLVALKLTSSQDREAIGSWIEGQGDKAEGRAMLATLPGKQRGEGVLWIPGRDILRNVQFPPKATFDSSRTPKRGEKREARELKPINLDALKTKLASVETDAKANDPRALKAEVARLTRELASKPAVAASKDDATALRDREAAFAGGIRQGRDTGFTEGWLAGEKVGFTRGVSDTQRAFKTSLAQIAVPMADYVPSNAPKAPKNTAPVALAPPQSGVTHAPAPAQRASIVRSAAVNNIEAPLQKIIDAIKWWDVMGAGVPSHAQVGFIAGYSHKSGTWATYLSRLRSQGLIEGRGDLALTTEGERIANLPDAPPTGEALRETVLAKIDAPLRKIMTPIFEAYPNGLDHASAGAAAGYSHSSGTWATYLSRLRTLDLIEGRGELKAQGWLFP